jgi:hypothetical protein
MEKGARNPEIFMIIKAVRNFTAPAKRIQVLEIKEVSHFELRERSRNKKDTKMKVYPEKSFGINATF